MRSFMGSWNRFAGLPDLMRTRWPSPTSRLLGRLPFKAESGELAATTPSSSRSARARDQESGSCGASASPKTDENPFEKKLTEPHFNEAPPSGRSQYWSESDRPKTRGQKLPGMLEARASQDGRRAGTRRADRAVGEPAGKALAGKRTALIKASLREVHRVYDPHLAGNVAHREVIGETRRLMVTAHERTDGGAVGHGALLPSWKLQTSPESAHATPVLGSAAGRMPWRESSET